MDDLMWIVKHSTIGWLTIMIPALSVGMLVHVILGYSGEASLMVGLIVVFISIEVCGRVYGY